MTDKVTEYKIALRIAIHNHYYHEFIVCQL